MPTKPVKKTTAKTTTAKKPAAKKATIKKPVAKKTAKPVIAPETIITAPVPETPKCKCGADCACGAECKCARGGSKFGRFVMRLIVVLIVFALGFAAAKLIDGGRDFRGPRVDFDNGCLKESSVKCPQIRDALPVMDVNGDGCISRDEYRAIMREMHRQMRATNAPTVSE